MYNVWLRNFLFFRKTFMVSLFWTTLEPLMFLGAFGFGFGHYISSIEGMSFLQFYFAGLLCTTSMMVAYFEATYPNYTKMTHQKTYAAMLLTPVSTQQIFFGEMLWAATKGFLGVLGVFLISSLFGLFNPNFFVVAPILFLLSLVFASFGMIMISIAKNYDSFVFSTSGVIVPLSMISGTYFSLEEIPYYLKTVAYIFPLAHAVRLVRTVLYRELGLFDLVHIAVLLAYLVIFSMIGQRLFTKKLVN
ncbi:ABC transporter permease [Bdellovibrio sp. qaytius]|nr:ABC transporter permease [Bdellovibrio sp. qaytius]